MNNKGKASTFILVFLLILFSFAILGIAAYFFISFEKEKAARIELSQNIDSLEDQKAAAERKLEEANKQKLLLERKFEEQGETILDLNQKLEQATREKMTIVYERDSLNDRISKLVSENEIITTQLEEKTNEIMALEDDLQTKLAQLDALQQVNAGKQKGINASASSMAGEGELGTIVVSPSLAANENIPSTEEPVIELDMSQSESSQATQQREEGYDADTNEDDVVFAPDNSQMMPLGAGPSETNAVQPTVASKELNASVLLVNRQHNFIVFDAGKQDGVAVGDVLDVFHEGKFIGSVVVQKTHDTLSAADFQDNFNVDSAQEADSVKRSR